jgi:hypothetical protein
MDHNGPTGIVLKFPLPDVTDHDFLDAVEGYIYCLNPEQEARLSPKELIRLTKIARRATGP